jgi:hypothetical protein
VQLDPLQQDFLREFFAQQSHFYLTGGAALVGFYLGHRKTHALDLFTLENEIETGAALARDVARKTSRSRQST